jgi:hypothetical protein
VEVFIEQQQVLPVFVGAERWLRLQRRERAPAGPADR